MDAGSEGGGDWPAFARRLRRVFGDAVRLELARGVKPSAEYGTKLSRLHARVVGTLPPLPKKASSGG